MPFGAPYIASTFLSPHIMRRRDSALSTISAAVKLLGLSALRTNLAGKSFNPCRHGKSSSAPGHYPVGKLRAVTRSVALEQFISASVNKVMNFSFAFRQNLGRNEFHCFRVIGKARYCRF